MSIEKRTITTKDEWLEWRKNDLTASKIGALFSCHPYTSPLRLYLEHSGIEFPSQDDNPVLRRGRLLESAVAQAVAEERPEWKVEKNSFYFREPDLRLGCTPDFFLEGDPRGTGILQCKTTAPSVFDRKGEDGWDQGRAIPTWVTLQCLMECMLTGAAFGTVAVMKVDAYDLKCTILDVPRHPSAEEKIIAQVKQFWNDVREGREPTPDYGKDADLVPIIAPRAEPGKVVDLSEDNELPILLDQRAELKSQIKARQDRCDQIETELKFKIRDAERVVGVDGWDISFRSVHQKEFVMKAKDYRSLRITDRRGST